MLVRGAEQHALTGNILAFISEVAVSNVNRDTNYHDVVLRTAQNVK
jgi:hypothetical protein